MTHATNFIIRLDANENPYGMSKLAARALRSAQQTATRYPDETLLRSALAGMHQLEISNVLLGNGSSEILDMIARTFLDTASEAVCSAFSFMPYRIVTEHAGARNVVVPANNFGHDLPAMIAAITPRTKIMWVANPNNPTGTFIPHHRLKKQLQKIPQNIIVVLDEAYHEYLHPAERSDTTEWLRTFPNLIIVRTFSKIYGLAGLRVGYAFANPAIIKRLNELKPRFSINAVGLAAAKWALGDQIFIEESYKLNSASRKELKQSLEALGLSCIETHGNFVTCQVGNAQNIRTSLLHRGVSVLPLTAYNLPEHIRISVGKPSENARLLKELRAVLK